MCMCSRSTESRDVFGEIEMNNECNIRFLQNSLLGIQNTYFSKFFTNQIIPLNILKSYC